MTLEVLFTCPRTSIKHLSSIRVQLQVYSLLCAPQYPSLMKVMERNFPPPPPQRFCSYVGVGGGSFISK